MEGYAQWRLKNHFAVEEVPVAQVKELQKSPDIVFEYMIPTISPVEDNHKIKQDGPTIGPMNNSSNIKQDGTYISPE